MFSHKIRFLDSWYPSITVICGFAQTTRLTVSESQWHLDHPLDSYDKNMLMWDCIEFCVSQGPLHALPRPLWLAQITVIIKFTAYNGTKHKTPGRTAENPQVICFWYFPSYYWHVCSNPGFFRWKWYATMQWWACVCWMTPLLRKTELISGQPVSKLIVFITCA